MKVPKFGFRVQRNKDFKDVSHIAFWAEGRGTR